MNNHIVGFSLTLVATLVTGPLGLILGGLVWWLITKK